MIVETPLHLHGCPLPLHIRYRSPMEPVTSLPCVCQPVSTPPFSLLSHVGALDVKILFVTYSGELLYGAPRTENAPGALLGRPMCSRHAAFFFCVFLCVFFFFSIIQDIKQLLHFSKVANFEKKNYDQFEKNHYFKNMLRNSKNIHEFVKNVHKFKKCL